MNEQHAMLRSGDLEALIIRSDRRTVSLQVNRDLSLTIRASKSVTVQFLVNFLEERRAWISRHRQRLFALNAKKPTWQNGTIIQILDARYRLAIEPGTRLQAKIASDRLIVSCPEPNNTAMIAKAIDRLYARIAHQFFPLYVEKCLAATARYKFPHPVLKYRVMKSRWGSCSPSTTTITLNTRLASLPSKAVEYVILHELAHFRFCNHGKSFRALLSRLCPDWKSIKKSMAAHALESGIFNAHAIEPD